MTKSEKYENKAFRICLAVAAAIVIFFLHASFASAFGIQHTQTEIYSEQMNHYEGEFWIVNDGHENMELSVFAEGALEDYVKLEKDSIAFSSDDDIKAVKFSIDIPGTLPPGQTETYISVAQKFNPDKKNIIESQIVLKHKIVVYGPLPSKYVKAKIGFREYEDKVELISEVKNMGKEEINSVKTEFVVNGIEQEKPIETNEASLDVHETKLLKAELDKDKFTNGEYKVSAVTTYDGFQIESSKSILVGKPEVDVVYFNKYFIYNQINKYAMDLENKWNKQVENVYVNVNVLRNNKTVDSFRTPSVNIQGFMTKRVSDYFDARGKPKGDYAFDMVVHFWNTYKMDKKRFYAAIISPGEVSINIDENEPVNIKWLALYLAAFLSVAIIVLGYVILRLNRRWKQ